MPLKLLAENRVYLLLGVEPKDTTTIRRRKDFLFAASKENTGGLSQISVSPKQQTGELLS